MRRLLISLGIAIVAALALSFILTSCTDNPVITTGKPVIVHKIQPIAWNSEFKAGVLTKDGYASGVATPNQGTVVGGNDTYGVSVYIPAGAVGSATEITLKVPKGDIAVAEFGPSMQFNKPVTVTFPYDALDLGGKSPYELKPIWFNPSTGEWEYVSSSVTVNTENKTISFQTNHFSRYAWSF